MGAIFVGYALIHNISVLGLASMENISIPEIFGARNRYTLTAVVREVAAIVATGIGPVVAAAWVAEHRPPTLELEQAGDADRLERFLRVAAG